MPISFMSWWPVLLLPVVAFIWWTRNHSDTSLSGRHLAVLTWVRTGAVVLLILALMRPVWSRASQSISAVFLIDVSKSIAPDFLQAAIRWTREATETGKPEHARFLAFADHATAVDTPEALGSVAVFDSTALGANPNVPKGAIDQSETNIEVALRHAITSFAPHALKRLVIVSDGHETQGEIEAVVGDLKEHGIRVFTVPAAVRSSGDSWIERLEIREDVRAKEMTEVGVVVFSRAPKDVTVELHTASASLGRKELSLEPGFNRMAFDVQLEEPGLVVLEAELQSADAAFADNDRISESVSVGPAPHVLYVEGHRESAVYLRQALESEGIDVTLGDPSVLRSRQIEWGSYDAVILSDVPARSFSLPAQRSLATYVRDESGGLIFVAGETSFGEEGYADSVVEGVLPIDFRVEEKWKDLSLIIVLDKSYSMYGRKIALAKEATKAALDLLEDKHRFGVITFDWNPYTTIPLQLATNKDWIKEGISRIQASAQTNIYPALEKALEQLVESPSKVKHVILLSDGKTYPDDYEELLIRMGEEEITVSTVAVGEEADRELLASIADWGGGRSYFIEDAERVQQIFIEETQIALEATLIEEPFKPLVKLRVEALRGIEFEDAPELRGYVSTKPKETAEVLLEAEDEDPLLARWHYGLGTSVFFASDAKNRWATEWLGWEGYGQFWSQIVRETVRRTHGAEIDFRVERRGDEAEVTLHVIDETGHYPSDLEPFVDVTEPSSGTRTVAIRQTGPGRYRASIPLGVSKGEPYRFRLNAEGLPGESQERVRSVFYPFPDEYRFYPADTERLRFLSKETGGKFQPEVEEVFADDEDRARVPTALWPFLAALALVLYLVDIALRRAPWLWLRLEDRRLSATSPART